MSDKSNKPVTNVKAEPSSYKRLPSFRSPRDLNLTEFQKISSNPSDPKKKVYKPNLNVQRRKSDQPAAKEKDKNEKVEEVKNEKASPVEKGRRERGKKKQLNLIQSSGVFSEGLAPSMKTGWWNSRFSDASTPSMLERPKFKGQVKVNKEEEAMVIKELLRDDFIDDPSCVPDVKQCPIKLPLKNFGGDIFCKTEEVGSRAKDEGLLKTNKVKVKVEADLEGDDVSESKKQIETVPRSLDEMVPLTISQLMSQSSDSSFIFFQLPHVMPKEKTFLPTSTKQSAKPAASTSSTALPNPSPSESEEKCVLKNLPEGKIGKLQLLKSGRARLILGDAQLIVDPGTQPSFKQDVIALVDVAPTTKTGSMVHIGNITSRVIVSPDWETLLNDS